MTGTALAMAETQQPREALADRVILALTIDPEFQRLIPPLDAEELALLEQNIVSQGCLEPLYVWSTGGETLLIDGHNRYAICRAKKIPFTTISLDFPSRLAAKIWMIDHQNGRRNLNPFQRTELALLKEEFLKEIGQAKRLEGNATGGKVKPLSNQQDKSCQNSDKPSAKPSHDTLKIIAKAAGVSRDTTWKVKQIRESAPTEVAEKARTGQLSVNRAFQVLQAVKDLGKDTPAQKAATAVLIDESQTEVTASEVKAVVEEVKHLPAQEQEEAVRRELGDAVTREKAKIRVREISKQIAKQPKKARDIEWAVGTLCRQMDTVPDDEAMKVVLKNKKAMPHHSRHSLAVAIRKLIERLDKYGKELLAENETRLLKESN